MYGNLESAEQAQRERDLCCGRERRMAAREDEAKAIVFHVYGLLDDVVGIGERESLDVTVVAGGLAAQTIDGPIPRRRGDPATGVRR